MRPARWSSTSAASETDPHISRTYVKNILVTGAAGFIGAAVCARLLQLGHRVVGLDNINDYYDPALKYARLAELGVAADSVAWYKFAPSSLHDGFSFIRMNLQDTQAMRMLFANGSFDTVINLGAQAGVRYSITNPHAYIESNVDGFINVLEGCRENGVGHLVYASPPVFTASTARCPSPNTTA